jgi:hypothetical protein
MVTTIVSEDGATIVSEQSAAAEGSFGRRISWGAIFAGAVVGTATIFFLLTLGAGVGLSLVPAPGVVSKGFLTLGAIYFLAAQAAGFAAGGHVVGRLMNPAIENDREEEFRAAAHGLTVWGLCVTATAILVLMSSWVAAGSSAIAGGMAMSTNNTTNPTPAVASYWTDVLFRPAPAPMHASLAWRQFAQADNTATDASPATSDDEAPNGNAPAATPMTPAPATGKVENDTPQSAPATTSQGTRPQVITIPSEEDAGSDTNAGAGAAGNVTAPAGARSLPADKAEVGRILEVGMANGGTLSQYDHDRVAELVAQDTGVSTAEASRRVDNAEARIRSDQMKTAEAARKAARNASLWIAFALLFGALVAGMAAVSARWEDDRISLWPGRSEPA